MRISASFRDPQLTPSNYESILSRVTLATHALRVAGLVTGTWWLQTDHKTLSATPPSAARITPSPLITNLTLTAPRPLLTSAMQRAYRGMNHCVLTLVAESIGSDTQHTMVCHIDAGPAAAPSALEINLRGPIDGTAASYVEVVHALAMLYRPSYISVAPEDYDELKLLEDSPGAGWMLYLPRKIEPAQVESAEAVIPLYEFRFSSNPPAMLSQQLGTVLVSVMTSPLNTACVAHMLRSFEVEQQLAANGLLPKYDAL
jgi:hypothetical protein